MTAASDCYTNNTNKQAIQASTTVQENKGGRRGVGLVCTPW